MELRREILTGFIVVLLLFLVMAFATISLLTRFGARLEHELERDTELMQHIDELFAMQARYAGQPLEDDTLRRYSSLLADIDESHAAHDEIAALAGMMKARVREASEVGGFDELNHRGMINELVQLSSIARSMVLQASREGRRLDAAAAWLVFAVAVIGFILMTWVIRRTVLRILVPLEDVIDVVEAAHSGDRLRRCQTEDAPAELKKLDAGINALLDGLLEMATFSTAGFRSDNRQISNALIERIREPCWVMSPDANVLMTNQSGMDALQGERGRETRRTLHRIVEESSQLSEDEALHVEGWEVYAVAERGGYVCVQVDAESAPEHQGPERAG